MCGGFDHAPDGTGRADATTFAGIRDQEVVTAVGVAGPGKPMGEGRVQQGSASVYTSDRSIRVP